MTNDKTTIGLICLLHDSVHLFTVAQLRDELKNTRYTAQQYCDWRYATNLQRFVYDPYTGNKIDWKEVKRLLTEQ